MVLLFGHSLIFTKRLLVYVNGSSLILISQE
jgi:hypothetical protein